MNSLKKNLSKKNTTGAPSNKVIVNKEIGTKKFKIDFFHRPICKYF